MVDSFLAWCFFAFAVGVVFGLGVMTWVAAVSPAAAGLTALGLLLASYASLLVSGGLERSERLRKELEEEARKLKRVARLVVGKIRDGKVADSWPWHLFVGIMGALAAVVFCIIYFFVSLAVIMTSCACG